MTMERTIRPVIFSTGQASRYTPFFIAMILLFVLSIAIPKGQDVLFINGHHSPFLDSFFKTITNLGDGMVFVPVIIGLVFVRYRYAIIALIIAIAHGLLANAFKRGMFPNAVRPRKFLGDEVIHFVHGVDVHSVHSFPSGHTATAFCLALFIALLLNNRTHSILLLAAAVLVGYSRIYLAQHFLLDVAAGAIIGSFTTFITWEIFRSTRTPNWMNQRLKLFPKGPSEEVAMR